MASSHIRSAVARLDLCWALGQGEHCYVHLRSPCFRGAGQCWALGMEHRAEEDLGPELRADI